MIGPDIPLRSATRARLLQALLALFFLALIALLCLVAVILFLAII